MNAVSVRNGNDNSNNKRSPLGALVKSFREIKRQMKGLERDLDVLHRGLSRYRKRHYTRQVS